MNTLMATKPELAIYQALQRMGLNFEFQSKMLGGRDQKGGLVGDFYLAEYSLLINVQGEYWHSKPDRMAQDKIQRISLESRGIRTIWIDALDALRNPKFYIQEALRGVDHSLFSRL